jgi:predicted Fe-Mo cluster-binding NifX family protein
MKREQILLAEESPIEKVARLVKMGVSVLICGGITESCANMLRGSNITIIPWVQGEVETVLHRFLQGPFQSETINEGAHHVVLE